MRKADYTYEIKNDVVSIIDLNLGNLSVTNDIENILTEINKTKNIIGKRFTDNIFSGNSSQNPNADFFLPDATSISSWADVITNDSYELYVIDLIFN